MKRCLILIALLPLLLLLFNAVGVAFATDYIDISPSGGSGADWTDISKSYDGLDSTYAISNSIELASWSEPLILSYDPVNTTAVKYLVGRSNSDVTQINLDAYYDSDWHDVFEGAPTWNIWQGKSLDTNHVVSQVRIYFYNSSVTYTRQGYVYEQKWVTIVWPPSDLSEYTGYYTYSANNTAFDWLDTPPDEPSTLYTELDTSYIPGGSIIDEILLISNTPKALWWFPFIFVGICICGLLVYDATQRTGGEGSLFVMCISIEAMLLFFGILGMAEVANLIPMWPAFLFPIPATALVLSRRHVGWG